MKTFAVIAAICIASANAASTLNRMRTNPGHKSVARRLNNGNEEYDPFMDMNERELQFSMSMAMMEPEVDGVEPEVDGVEPEVDGVESMASSG